MGCLLYLASSADFAEAVAIITDLVKEREPGIEIIKCTPGSLIITITCNMYCWYSSGSGVNIGCYQCIEYI